MFSFSEGMRDLLRDKTSFGGSVGLLWVLIGFYVMKNEMKLQ